jgi:glycosyltransferase involved in cell wall biosynthesis
MSKVAARVVHYGANDPETYRGGVESFARNLRLIFDEVSFMFPGKLDVDRVRREKLLVVCDNHWVTDWPDDIPVVGFQHGVAAVKASITGNRTGRKMAKRQGKAAKRKGTIWVACAQWIANTFEALHGNGAQHVIYHQVDLDRFDGQRRDTDPKLILHDARGAHKGEAEVAALTRRFPDWKLEPLACEPSEVPDRMRKAAAFLHLSRYEGNSIVVNEALAMDLPCFVTKVGLMKDEARPQDVHVVDAEQAFGNANYLDQEFAAFLRSLSTRSYAPRQWTLANAHIDVARDKWRDVVQQWQSMW